MKRAPRVYVYKLTYWDMMQARSHALEIIEILGWRCLIDNEPERTNSFHVLRRVRYRLLSDIAMIASCEFDSTRNAVAILDARRKLTYGSAAGSVEVPDSARNQ